MYATIRQPPRLSPALTVVVFCLLSACSKPTPEAAQTPTAQRTQHPVGGVVDTPRGETKKKPPSRAATKPAGHHKAPPAVSDDGRPKPPPTLPPGAQVVEASCGQCNFGLTEPKGCDLAVRIEGKAYFVEGSHIDDHGDAHAERGMCNAIRRAAVKGEVIEGRFVARTFKLID